jgi:hypothetical protein
VETNKGLVEGQVGQNALSYSGQTVLSITDYRKRQNTAMVAPKSLNGNGGKWVVINREPNSKYEMDPIYSLDLVGDVTKKKLKKQGLVTIQDIKDLSSEQMEAIAKLEKVDRIGLPQMLGFQEQAKKAILGRAPEKTDYRKAENPWKARYGKDWEKKLDQSSLMSPYCSIKHWWRTWSASARGCSKVLLMNMTGYFIMMRCLY